MVKQTRKKAVSRNPAAKKKATTPWTFNSLLPDICRFPKKHVGFKPALINKEEVEEYLDNGWVLAKREDYGMKENPLAGDSTTPSVIRRKGMIVVEIPVQQAKEREKLHDTLTDIRSGNTDSQVSQVSAQLSREGVDFEISGGINI